MGFAMRVAVIFSTRAEGCSWRIAEYRSGRSAIARIVILRPELDTSIRSMVATAAESLFPCCEAFGQSANAFAEDAQPMTATVSPVAIATARIAPEPL